mmetsp:Transcript_2492/g.8363  ORF Transcript_2492/g.8363 Transcript_2492/m.8363 type:complete len:236 (-) Transcript_2492:1530-2237(-)
MVLDSSEDAAVAREPSSSIREPACNRHPALLDTSARTRAATPTRVPDASHRLDPTPSYPRAPEDGASPRVAPAAQQPPAHIQARMVPYLSNPLPHHPTSIAAVSALPAFPAAALRLRRNCAILAFISTSGTSMSTVRRWRVKGSVSSESRWRQMVGRSMSVPDGRRTGSTMISMVIGSRNSSGTSPNSSSSSSSAALSSTHLDRNVSSASSPGWLMVGGSPDASTRTALLMLFGE